MKKNLVLLCLLWLASVSLVAAQGTRTFNVSNFSRLSMGSAFQVEVRQGSQYSLKATGDQQDLDDLEASVSNRTLRVRYQENKRRNRRERISITITMPTLEGVDFSGASQVNVSGFNDTKSMAINISGASKVTMDVSAERVSLDLSGASVLTLNGKGNVLNGRISGASVFKGKDFPVKEANLDASGASNAAIVANASLTAEASGASTISYSGNAREVRSSTSGASSIRRSN
ncbi:hypothetical protein GCM10027275_39600 [Rhabdobacter roseus]|uniref:Preprotein translocase subunit SecF n=1 Tax=Rhabdobacter roseus TaxID=1655419 RepID=A0A840TN19_9BACT|nr:head GIN domain-containing protein [Rhabdobacter roseus]MBB5285666.1 preprotein translocase subunit SecF [Rhabdobacter roseus]